VVRELLENALDAGASAIRVEVREGGLRLIRVADDGRGIAGEELALACQPHTTSKVRTLRDLDAIATLGFRGEALASIAAAAEVELTSATDESGLARSLTLTPGGQAAKIASSRPRGTTLTVRELFQSLPARRAMFARAGVETTKIFADATRVCADLPGGAVYARSGWASPGADARARSRWKCRRDVRRGCRA